MIIHSAPIYVTHYNACATAAWRRAQHRPRTHGHWLMNDDVAMRLLAPAGAGAAAEEEADDDPEPNALLRKSVPKVFKLSSQRAMHALWNLRVHTQHLWSRPSDRPRSQRKQLEVSSATPTPTASSCSSAAGSRESSNMCLIRAAAVGNKGRCCLESTIRTPQSTRTTSHPAKVRGGNWSCVCTLHLTCPYSSS